MPDFHDVRFPLHLAFGASGGPFRTTHILQLDSGGEARNSPYRHSRRRYNAVAGLKSEVEATEIISFFEARFGPLHAFRFRDPLDHSATDEIIGYGDGERLSFQLSKNYGADPHIYTRVITKPVTGTVRVAVNGVEVAAVTVDPLTGEVTFQSPPAIGAIITADFEFDVPVRFASEAMDIVLDDFGATQIQDIPLIEVLDHV